MKIPHFHGNSTLEPFQNVRKMYCMGETCWSKLRVPFGVGMEPHFVVMYYHLSAVWIPVLCKKIWLTFLYSLCGEFTIASSWTPISFLAHSFTVGGGREIESQNWEKTVAQDRHLMKKKISDAKVINQLLSPANQNPAWLWPMSAL